MANTAAQKVRADIARKQTRERQVDRIENAWERYLITENWADFYKNIENFIKQKAKYCAVTYRNVRLFEDDFMSEFQLVAFELANEEQYTTTPFYYRLRKRLGDRVKNMYRDATKPDIRRAHTFAEDVDEVPGVNISCISGNYISGHGRLQIPSVEEINAVETEVCNRIEVEQLLSDSHLTEQEREFLSVIYRNPGASFRELAAAAGFSHQEKARRTLQAIQRKLSKQTKLNAA